MSDEKKTPKAKPKVGPKDTIHLGPSQSPKLDDWSEASDEDDAPVNTVLTRQTLGNKVAPQRKEETGVRSIPIGLDVKDLKTANGVDLKLVDHRVLTDVISGAAIKGRKGGKKTFKSLKDPNIVWRMRVSDYTTHTMTGSGQNAGSLRFGDPTLWTNTSTYAALFGRYRVVSCRWRFAPTTLDTGAGSTPHQLVSVVELALNSLSIGNISAGWAIPSAKVMQMAGTGTGANAQHLAIANSARIAPTQEWYDVGASTTETQPGCLAWLAEGFTVSVAALELFSEYIVEFQNLLL